MLAIMVAASLVGVASCSSDSGDSSAKSESNQSTASTSTSAIDRPEGPAAEVAGPLEGGDGPVLAASDNQVDLATKGFVQEEYSASGTASAYAGDMPVDGRFDLKTTTQAPYSTRIMVRRPAKASDFDGTVVVEWLNVSSGLDAAPDWTYLQDEILRQGHAWVGVSAQLIGIEGGAVAVLAPGAEEAGAGKGLVNIDPARYGAMNHPGDAYSYDIYTQVARALRKPRSSDPLGSFEVEQLLAVGESQSAFALTTYVDGIQPLTRAFDGFLIHSRGAAPFPLGAPDAGVDISAALGGQPTKIRTDLGVPVIMVETETDLLSLIGFYPARQADTDKIRLWEVAGTAHADKEQVGSTESTLGCTAPVNRGQQGFVVEAALRNLAVWADGGDAPPKSPGLETQVVDGKPAFVTDENGNVLGGVRTPVVDAPVDLLTGLAPPDATLICLLFGQTQPLSADRLAALYSSRSAYEDEYAAATDAAIDAGFVLPEDRAKMISQAQPDRIPA